MKQFAIACLIGAATSIRVHQDDMGMPPKPSDPDMDMPPMPELISDPCENAVTDADWEACMEDAYMGASSFSFTSPCDDIEDVDQQDQCYENEMVDDFDYHSPCDDIEDVDQQAQCYTIENYSPCDAIEDFDQQTQCYINEWEAEYGAEYEEYFD